MELLLCTKLVKEKCKSGWTFYILFYPIIYLAVASKKAVLGSHRSTGVVAKGAANLSGQDKSLEPPKTTSRLRKVHGK